MDPRDTQEHDSVITVPHAAPVSGGGDTTRRTPPEFVLPLPGAPPSSAAPGERRIGNYRLLRELGRGGMGVVHLAEHVGLRRRVALKVLAAAGDAELVERFQVEARAAARLNHPNVVGVHEVGQDGARWFLAMALVEGESLRARVVRDGPLPCREAARIVEAVARGLQHAHERGVLHRDVKPHNILLSREGSPSLADFGLAREVDASGVTVTGQVMGTPAYMPPEQAAGDHARVDRRADVYSLGATLYEALTGRPPFQGPTAINVLRQVIEDAPEPPSRLRPDLDRDLETICLRCLEKAPAARYDTAGELADDLARYGDGLPILARRPGRAERIVRWAQRRPGAAVALVAALVLVQAGVGAGAGLALQRRRDRAAAREAALAAWTRFEQEPAADASPDARRRRTASAHAAAQLAARWFELDPDPQARDALHDAARRAGELALVSSHFDTAMDCFRLGQRATPDDPTLGARVLWLERLRDAKRLIFRADPAGARRLLDAAIADAPEWPEAYVIRAHILEGIKDPVNALADLERALERAPEHPEVLPLWASLRETLGRGDPRADWNRVVAACPGDPGALWRRAAAHWSAGDHHAALADLDAAVELDPALSHVLEDRGVLRLEAGDRAGIDDLERAYALEPESPRLSRRLGEAYAYLGRTEAAVEALERAIALGPGNALQYGLLADAHARAGDMSSALEVLSRGLTACPDDPDLLRRRVGHLMARGEHARAIVDCDQLLAVAPDAVILATRADARRLSGDLAGAEADAGAALVLRPGLPHALLVRGLAREERGDGAGALADLDGWLRAGPRDGPVVARVRELVARLRSR